MLYVFGMFLLVCYSIDVSVRLPGLTSDNVLCRAITGATIAPQIIPLVLKFATLCFDNQVGRVYFVSQDDLYSRK